NFLFWIGDQLLPTLAAMYPGQPMVIILDNVSIHQNPDVVSLTETHGHIVRYLPPYLPNSNPIKLTFGVLKAWIKR
ncbi:hypothetical protein EJ04DRAFT_390689, partial [Polyplosphaeria fusca]